MFLKFNKLKLLLFILIEIFKKDIPKLSIILKSNILGYKLSLLPFLMNFRIPTEKFSGENESNVKIKLDFIRIFTILFDFTML